METEYASGELNCHRPQPAALARPSESAPPLNDQEPDAMVGVQRTMRAVWVLLLVAGLVACPSTPRSTAGPVVEAPRLPTVAPLVVGDEVSFRQETGLRVYPEGVRIGRALAGARAVVAELRPEGVLVRLSDWERSSVQPYRPNEPVRVVVPREILVAGPVRADAPSLREGTVVVDHVRTLSPVPSADGALLVSMGCGPARIIDERRVEGRTWQQVAQRRDGVEVVGWTDEPIRTQRGLHCSQNRLYPRELGGAEPPDDFVAVTADLDAHRLLADYPFWIELDGEGYPICRESHRSGPWLVTEAYRDDSRFPGELVQRRYRVAEHGAWFELQGPETFFVGKRRRVRARCAAHFTLLAVDPERAAVVAAWDHVAAYRPGTHPQMFRTARACERAAEALAIGSGADPGELSMPLFGC